MDEGTWYVAFTPLKFHATFFFLFITGKKQHNSDISRCLHPTNQKVLDNYTYFFGYIL